MRNAGGSVRFDGVHYEITVWTVQEYREIHVMSEDTEAKVQFASNGIPATTFDAAPLTTKMPLPRRKVAVKPGRSMMDWVKLTNSGQNLR
ncbi:hypothetical protein SARC_14017, partial [Sphaeroforma arctica JP610]